MQENNILHQIVKLISNNLYKIISYKSHFLLKSDNSYVSKGDLLVQKIVIEYFNKFLPEHIIVSEEMSPFENINWENGGNYIFLDPIDGTENFISGLKEWGVGISIYTKGKHDKSCIFLPELNEVLITGDKVGKFKSRIIGLSSSLNVEDLMNLPKGDFEFRIIGCSMYNMFSAIKGSFYSFENVKGVSCWDVLPGLNLALENNVKAFVDGEIYKGEILFPTKKYKIKLINSYS